MKHCRNCIATALNPALATQVELANNLAVFATSQEELVKKKRKQLTVEKLKNRNLQKTIKHLQNTIVAIQIGLTSIETGAEDLRTSLSFNIYPVDKLDKLKTIIESTEEIAVKAKLISNCNIDSESNNSEILSDIVNSL